METLQQLLSKYLAGKCTPEEVALVEAWFYATDDTEPVPELQQEGKRRRLETDIYRAIALRTGAPRARLLYLHRWKQLAAACMVLAAGAALFLLKRPQKRMPVDVTAQWQECITRPGQTRQVRLPDSTIVYLNMGTTLRIPPHFNDSTREVWLPEGEAMFAVRQDAARPFIVHSGALTTRVLGTVFNVRSYAYAAQLKVSVLEGCVQVSDSTRRLGVLRASEEIVWDKESRSAPAVRSVQMKAEADWRSGWIHLQDADLHELAGTLHDLYNIQLVYKYSPTRKHRYTMHFNRRDPLPQVLKMMAAIHHERYSINGQTVTIFK